MGDSLRPHLKLQNLYVRDISREASPAVVRAYLEKLGGPACHVKLPLDHNNNDKHIGIAYLNFNTFEESKKCLEKYRFSIRFKNQPAKLMYAPQDKDRVFGPYSFRFQIIIKNLSEEVDVQMLHSFFLTYGEIFQCKTDIDDHQQYYGQVTYIDVNSVAMAVAGADRTRWQSSVIEVVPHHKAHMAEEYDRPRASTSSAGNSEQAAVFGSSSGASSFHAHAAQRGVPTSATSSSSGQPQQPALPPPPPPPSASLQQRHQEQQQHADDLSDHAMPSPTPVNFALDVVYGTSSVPLPPPFSQPIGATPVPLVPDSNALSPLDIPVAVPVAVPDGSRSAGLIGRGAVTAAGGPTDGSSTGGPSSVQAGDNSLSLERFNLGSGSGSVTPPATGAQGGAAAADGASQPAARTGASYLLDMLQRRRVDASSSSRPDTPSTTPHLSHVGMHPYARAVSPVLNGRALDSPAVGTGQTNSGRGHPMVSVCSGATVIISPGGRLSGHSHQPKVGVLRGVLSSIEFISETLCCPITHELFVEPVVAADGITYERVAIENWLSNHDTSPMSNEMLTSPILHPNNLVKALVEELL